MLNGKAKEDFEQYVLSKYLEIRFRELVKCKISDGIPFVDYYDICELHLNALIIEWFDSVGVYISINYVNFVNELTSTKGFEAMITNKHLTTRFRETKTRKKATEQALEKANEIYNNQK